MPLLLFSGFLSTGDADSPGNYGILDQAMALQWVYDNVDAFNGDREKITLFGPGAGAASAGLLMVAPRSRDYVSKVIGQVSLADIFICGSFRKLGTDANIQFN